MRYVSPMTDKHTPISALYSFYDEFTKGFSVACRKGCSTCCTVNVAATTLETGLVSVAIGDSVPENVLKRLDKAASAPRYIPTTTLNRNTWQIIRGEEITPDTGKHRDGNCPLLDDEGLCTVYESRPFACRAMSSATPCSEGGEADMDQFLITINLAMYQIIEHLDSQGGITGNLSGLLLADITGRESLSGENRENTDALPQTRNCPLPGFMIPPDDRLRFRSFLRRLKTWPAGDGTLADWLPEEMPLY